MNSLSLQLKDMMDTYEKEKRIKQEFMENSDKYIFSTFDEFSDVPNEEEGLSINSSQKIQVINFTCHGSDILTTEKGKFKDYYDNINLYCNFHDNYLSSKSRKMFDSEVKPLKTPRKINLIEADEDPMDSRDLFEFSISENLEEISISSEESFLKSDDSL